MLDQDKSAAPGREGHEGRDGRVDFELRPPRLEDVVPYMDFLAQRDVSIWLDDSAQLPVGPAQVEKLLLHDAWAIWAISVDGRFAGVTSLYDPNPLTGTAYLSIVLGEQRHWGQGLGNDIVREVLHRGFTQLGLRKICSEILAPNGAALALHRRIGFHEDGVLRQDAWRRGKWVDRIVMSLLRDEFEDENNE